MSIVMLNGSFGSNIVEFNLFVVRSTGQYGRIRWECNLVDNTNMFSISLSFTVSLSVPNNNSSIITRRGHQSYILGKCSASDPILMAVKGIKEFPVIYAPHLNTFVITCTDEKLTITWKLNRSYWCTVSFDNCWISFTKLKGNQYIVLFHNLMVSSLAQEATNIPLGENWTSLTYPLWPMKRYTLPCYLSDHTYTIPSFELEAN